MSKAQHTASRATHLEAPAHLPRAAHAAHLPIDPYSAVQARVSSLIVSAGSKPLGEKVDGTALPSRALQHQALPASEEHLE